MPEQDPTPAEAPETPEAAESTEKTFTQADVERIASKARLEARNEERRKMSEKFADYDDLRAKAGTATTLEERVAAMEKRAIEAETSALRAKYAVDVPEELRPLLTGSTDEDLAVQRDLLVAKVQREELAVAERKKQGNRVPREGDIPKTGGNDPNREFVNELFGRANAD